MRIMGYQEVKVEGPNHKLPFWSLKLEACSLKLEVDRPSQTGVYAALPNINKSAVQFHMQS